jgi:hypothetical protein
MHGNKKSRGGNLLSHPVNAIRNDINNVSRLYLLF